MTDRSKRLLDLLQLEFIEENLYRGPSEDIGTGQVFGGQVLGQAITAAQATVRGRRLHSVHAYFLRKGDVAAPILYEVDRSRDGRSFSSRRVVAVQHGRPIFHLSASFQLPEPGLEYHYRAELPELPACPPADLPEMPIPMRNSAVDYFDTRPLPIAAREAGLNVGMSCWMKTQASLPDDPNLHQAILGYASDLGLLMATLAPHREQLQLARAQGGRIMMSSIDHAIWYHHTFRADHWFYYECRPLANANARGLAQGLVYDQSGRLLATSMQEGLIRPLAAGAAESGAQGMIQSAQGR